MGHGGSVYVSILEITLFPVAEVSAANCWTLIGIPRCVLTNSVLRLIDISGTHGRLTQTLRQGSFSELVDEMITHGVRSLRSVDSLK